MSIDQADKRKRKANRGGPAWQRFFMQVHVFFYRLTGGVIGGNLLNHSMLLLTTIGRKSGKERVTPLQYHTDGERYIVIASNGGATKDPLWWRNLLAHPQAAIQVGRKRLTVTARKAEGAERAELWARITAQWPNFAEYQEKTLREIPLVLLVPEFTHE